MSWRETNSCTVVIFYIAIGVYYEQENIFFPFSVGKNEIIQLCHKKYGIFFTELSLCLTLRVKHFFSQAAAVSAIAPFFPEYYTNADGTVLLDKQGMH